jgi:predicted CoA-binding protein
MASRYGDDETVTSILGDRTRTWAVVGLSNDTSRAAWGVAKFLQDHGKRIVPVHPRAETVHGEQGYRTLTEIPFEVDVVDVFVRSSGAGKVADDAVRIGAKAVWFQLGVVDELAYDRTRAVGVAMVMDRCPKIDWPTLGPAALA